VLMHVCQSTMLAAGPNGAGKSTLLNLIAGTLPVVGGARSVGDTTVLGNFTQHSVDMPEHISIIGWLRCLAKCHPTVHHIRVAIACNC
jgi:ABC transport system ATP-binding/permease protein